MSFLTLSSFAYAQTSGALRFNSTTKVLELYDGAAWISLGSGSVVSSCTGSDEGKIQYNGGAFVYQYCNGTNWLSLSTYTSATTCTTAGQLQFLATTKSLRFCNGTVWIYATSNHGYFVMTATAYTGNLGGLSGANSSCLSDLIANTWLGKSEATARGLLIASKVRAFLCDSTTCQNLNSNALYFYATGTGSSFGGAELVTDATAAGPGDAGNQWSRSDRFGASYNLHTGRSLGGSTLWGLTSATDTCSNWSTAVAGNFGQNGFTNTSGTGRWSNGTIDCSATRRLVCFVNP